MSDDVPLSATPVTAFYHGCMEISINAQQLDFDEALTKHNSIKSHSCPPVSAPESQPDQLQPHAMWPPAHTHTHTYLHLCISNNGYKHVESLYYIFTFACIWIITC